MMAGGPAPADARPSLICLVDTEEEFDWSAPFDRASIGVEHMRAIGPLQAIFESWGIRPTYAITYPIAAQPAGVEALRPLVASGRALVGAHLHPWVNPPDVEEVCERNSFPGNLPAALEREKLVNLTDRIEAGIGARPVIYKAGRYGAGPNTFAILEELGYTVDTSPAPPFDYSARHGPDYSRRGVRPEWVGPGRTVLSIPGTGALVGRFPNLGLYRAATDRPLSTLRTGAILARLGIVECLKLSPEGHNAREMQRLVAWLHLRGERLFLMTLHSPSVVPGHTPYVRSPEQLQAFLKSIDDFLRFFMTELDGRPTDPLAVRAAEISRRSAGPTA